MVGRCQHLQQMGFSHPAGPGQWVIGLEAERTLRDLGLRGDITACAAPGTTSVSNDISVS